MHKIQQISITAPCIKRQSYSTKGSSSIENLWPPNIAASIKHYPETLRSVILDDRFRNLVGAIFEAKMNDNVVALEHERLKLTQEGMLNFIVYDLQATGLPHPDHEPQILQMAFYKPYTGELWSTYVKPNIPINCEVSRLTNVYNSTESVFQLANGIRYYNHPLLSHPDVSNAAHELIQENPEIEAFDLIEYSVDKFLDSATENLVFLDQPDLNENVVIMSIHDAVASAVEMLVSDDIPGSLTIMLSHNGSCWNEPLLKAALEKWCSGIVLQNIAFIDSKELFKHLLRNFKIAIVPGSDPPWSKYLGEMRPPNYDSVSEVDNLWVTIKEVFTTLYNRNDEEFIFSRIVEDIYLNKSRR